jgi:hypothetical protein
VWNELWFSGIPEMAYMWDVLRVVDKLIMSPFASLKNYG